MPRIALSYRRADTEAITGRIFDRLLARYGQNSVFRDVDNIPLGVDFRSHINAILDESNIVLVVIGPRWLGGRGSQSRLANPADPVRIEVETALTKGTPVIPVLIGRAGMPHVDQLPESLADFAYRNAVRVDTGQDFDVHMARLIRAMDAMLSDGLVSGDRGASKEMPRDQPDHTAKPGTKKIENLAGPDAESTGVAGIGSRKFKLATLLVFALVLVAAASFWIVERYRQDALAEARRVAIAAQEDARARQQQAAAIEAARKETQEKARQDQAAAVEAARQEAETKARQQQTAAVEAARQEAEAKARQQQTAAVEAARQEAETKTRQEQSAAIEVARPGADRKVHQQGAGVTPAAHELGAVGSWAAYEAYDKTGRVCYVYGEPEKSQPPGAKRKQPMMMVTHRPEEKIANVVSVMEGYILRDSSDVVIDAGGVRFNLFVKDDSAWARTSELDGQIVATLAHARELVVTGTSSSGPATTDTYPLAGFPKALALIDKACGVKR